MYRYIFIGRHFHQTSISLVCDPCVRCTPSFVPTLPFPIGARKETKKHIHRGDPVSLINATLTSVNDSLPLSNHSTIYKYRIPQAFLNNTVPYPVLCIVENLSAPMFQVSLVITIENQVSEIIRLFVLFIILLNPVKEY